ncbi:hypothetical protein BCV69DRAFT_284474 [Microstroma glucosiphilum]|uniref:DUF1783-domain-containing protein n=1 Tax=Pseudomicrostroma glucosiphilum TaxID=1684307 RepID=A0A316U1T9_9BASI|nr:hypothetical protein BCV69DRAFT_284474 [Pseudomicrostroma glucosiphilum]PWN19332.1 hypothetical protein BCV69DRAFT_284474 [Pseudomicrostroma glucosiphilum]
MAASFSARRGMSTMATRSLSRRFAEVALLPGPSACKSTPASSSWSRAFASTSSPSGASHLVRYSAAQRGLPPFTNSSSPQSRAASTSTTTTPPSRQPPASPVSQHHQQTQGRALPTLPSRTPKLLLLALFSVISWSAFTLYAMNAERASSSAFRSVLSQLKDDHRVQEFLGGEKGERPIKGDVKWYAGGKVWVGGTVNMMQGRIDVTFGIKGEKDTATVYFTSFRPTQFANFENLRFLVVNDRTGEKISLLE